MPIESPTPDPCRRVLMAGGFALAALPVQAQTLVQTPAEGLLAGEVLIDAGGFAVPAYRAAPLGKGRHPVVLLVSEIFGVHAHIADVARRFARAGYLCIAPELFVRQGDAKNQPDTATLLREVIGKVPDAQVLADLDAVLAWAGANGGDLHRVAVTGFCYGGRTTWLYTAHQPKVKAGVAWYGRLLGNTTPLQPRHPLQVVDALHAPVLGLYGGQDTGIPTASVAQMQQALRASKNVNAQRSEFVLYRDAPHAFHADYRPSYRADDARDAWARCLTWFRQHDV